MAALGRWRAHRLQFADFGGQFFSTMPSHFSDIILHYRVYVLAGPIGRWPKANSELNERNDDAAGFAVVINIGPQR